MTELSKGPSMELEDVLEFLCPRGFPTFDEFKRNPDKYRIGRFHLFESIQDSTQVDRKDIKTQKMYWRHGVEAMNFGKLLRVIEEEGYKPEDVDVIPYRDKNSSGTGKDVIYVRVFPKFEIKLMGGIVPNYA